MLHLRVLDVDANLHAFRESVEALWQRRALIVEMTKRELTDRYAGQALGVAWAVIAPALMMATYLFTFTFIFKGRLNAADNGTDYMAYVLGGLVPWLGLQEGLSRSTTAVVASGNLVKQIVFPGEILPMKVALATIPGLVIGLVFAIGMSAIAGRLSVFGLFVLLPLAVLFYCVMLAGFSYILSSVGVFLRDIKDLIGFFLSIGLFLHPVLYAPGAAPVWLSYLFQLSPFSHMIWCFRSALIGDHSHPFSWIIFPVVSGLIFLLGWRTFRMLKPSFGNAL